MRIEYKKHIIESLYGLMEGSAKGLEDAIKDDFLIDHNIIPQKIEVKGTDKFIFDKTGHKIWVGSMTVVLKIDGETYQLSRDWEEEYYKDINHKDYSPDIDFYNSSKTYSSIKYRKLMRELKS
jgi:hypothetical protein